MDQESTPQKVEGTHHFSSIKVGLEGEKREETSAGIVLRNLSCSLLCVTGLASGGIGVISVCRDRRFQGCFQKKFTKYSTPSSCDPPVI